MKMQIIPSSLSSRSLSFFSLSLSLSFSFSYLELVSGRCWWPPAVDVPADDETLPSLQSRLAVGMFSTLLLFSSSRTLEVSPLLNSSDILRAIK